VAEVPSVSDLQMSGFKNISPLFLPNPRFRLKKTSEVDEF